MNWKHAKESRHARGYGTAWDKLRLRILTRDCGLCVPCSTKGLVTQATQVDHITPKSKGGTDDESNCQSICVPCHEAKTLADEGKQQARRAIGLDGWPRGG